MSKTIRIKLPGSAGMQEFKEVKATTLGELKQELAGKVNLNDQRIVVKEGRGCLKQDSDQLGDQDLTLFLSPLRVKSGSDL